MSNYSKGYDKGSEFFESLATTLKKQFKDFLETNDLKNNLELQEGFADGLSDCVHNVVIEWEK